MRRWRGSCERWSEPGRGCELIELGINHEQQHQELLLTDISEPVRRRAAEARLPRRRARRAEPAEPRQLDWIAFAGGIFDVGHDGEGFAYDNEGPRHEALVRPFKLANRCVTNAEWLEFIEDGGYATPTLWLADGWATVKAQGWTGAALLGRGRRRLACR